MTIQQRQDLGISLREKKTNIGAHSSKKRRFCVPGEFNLRADCCEEMERFSTETDHHVADQDALTHQLLEVLTQAVDYGCGPNRRKTPRLHCLLTIAATGVIFHSLLQC